MPRPSVPGSVPLTQEIDHHSLMLLGTGGAWDLQRDGWAYDVKYDGYPTLAVVAVAAGAITMGRSQRQRFEHEGGSR